MEGSIGEPCCMRTVNRLVGERVVQLLNPFEPQTATLDPSSSIHERVSCIMPVCAATSSPVLLHVVERRPCRAADRV